MIKCVIAFLKGFILFLDDGERVLKPKTWKMSPKFSIGHMVDRGAVNRDREHRREIIWGKGKVMLLNWIWDKLHWRHQLQVIHLERSCGHFNWLGTQERTWS